MGSRSRMRSVVTALGAVVLSGGVLAACSSSSDSSSTTTSSGHVLTVGTFHGTKGEYSTIQAAVDAAKKGDWILVAPGDYKETADLSNPSASTDNGQFGGVLITTAGVHLRGMDRNTTVVDGTKAGAAQCSAAEADQQFGVVKDGKAIGRNGIVVSKADNVSIDNLTVCNFLNGTEDGGNEIWWNGDLGTKALGLKGYQGSYLTATSTFYNGEDTAAQYGIFSSHAAGPARWSTIYGSNMNDSGMYVGACIRACDITIDKAWMEYSALGYSGTNSGGAIVVKNSRFNDNQDGFDTNTQINGDPPAPQDGACPGNATSPITHTHSCWVVMDNVFENNNNPNTPKAGNAAAGPTGTGMTIAGGRNDTVMNNTFRNNGAWGILFIPFPDDATPSLNQSCSGTGGVETAGFGCVYDTMNSKLANNTFENNGYFGNPSNADFGQLVLNPNKPSNCFVGNKAPKGSSPADLEKTSPTCGVNRATPNAPADLLAQVLCDTGFGTCPAGTSYPAETGVQMHPLPKNLATMPNPCAGVPDSAWCKGGKVAV